MKSTTTNRFFETLETRKLMSSSNITTDQPTDPAPERNIQMQTVVEYASPVTRVFSAATVSE